jgi:hypothetical protein
MERWRAARPSSLSIGSVLAAAAALVAPTGVGLGPAVRPAVAPEVPIGLVPYSLQSMEYQACLNATSYESFSFQENTSTVTDLIVASRTGSGASSNPNCDNASTHFGLISVFQSNDTLYSTAWGDVYFGNVTIQAVYPNDSRRHHGPGFGALTDLTWSLPDLPLNAAPFTTAESGEVRMTGAKVPSANASGTNGQPNSTLYIQSGHGKRHPNRVVECAGGNCTALAGRDHGPSIRTDGRTANNTSQAVFSTGSKGWALSLDQNLTNQWVELMKTGAAGMAAIVALLVISGIGAPAGGVVAAVAALLGAFAEYVTYINALGGNHGIYVMGVIGSLCLLEFLGHCFYHVRVYVADWLWYNPVPEGY